MLFYTEFAVLYEDKAMPQHELFCPSFWQAEDFDADGDYYAEGIDERWTDLYITRQEPGKPESTIRVHNHRERGPLLDHIDAFTCSKCPCGLQHYIENRRAYYYKNEHGGKIHAIDNLAATKLTFETTSVDDYREFLETVHRFLEYTNGSLVNGPFVMDAEEFRATFLEPAQS